MPSTILLKIKMGAPHSEAEKRVIRKVGLKPEIELFFSAFFMHLNCLFFAKIKINN
jgi:hypothetical protein